MIEQLVTSVCEWVARRLKLRTITREDRKPYLLRHYIQRHLDDHPWVPGLYLHCFVSSDDPHILHNHPFKWSLSLILTGGYEEERMEEEWIGSPYSQPHVTVRRRKVRPFTLNFIRANDFHRVDLAKTKAWTLFLAGPRVQDWGFLDPGTGRYTPWRQYVRERGETTESDRV